MCPSIFIDISFYQGYCPKTLFLFDNIQKPQWDLTSPLATPGLKSTQFLLALDMKIIEKYQNSSPSHGEDILVFYHTTNKLLYMT